MIVEVPFSAVIRAHARAEESGDIIDRMFLLVLMQEFIEQTIARLKPKPLAQA